MTVSTCDTPPDHDDRQHEHDHHHDTPEQRLESSLTQAAADPAYLALFYRALLSSTVYLPARGDAMAEADDDTLAIEHWEMEDGTRVIPFFSTPARLQQALTDGGPASWHALPVRELFALTRGETLFLNPRAEAGKAFYPQEVAMLLESGGMAQPQTLSIDGGAAIRVGPLERTPEALQSGLTVLCGQRNLVRSAWLAHFQDPLCDAQPVLLLALELEGNDVAAHQALIREAGTLASALLDQDDAIDVCCLRRDAQDPLADYLRTHVTPLYQRRWGGWLRNAIATRR
ncbi:enhanced serine sensitivity protein SseB C-terminal domain-containing protein [Edwardsiella anguillarum]|uniref:enhanced serine sensitivity protein SseB C-terminal domain-containing protein n=1 Tax=Edwardsiella anguillarum TaxID=1821960 RepID=UPI0005EDF141|nr:enhanced serine sensitivity protein SseB C-terminal domain-containing protein [Edwardsiella anguillarum]RFT04677.1 endopeptidase IV [Edwardsiella anguillarum]WHP79674.1 enhanced serine sensitivity protein SseB C-terminal domain-containing protein [Edwardsiella anguillarum]WHQ17133.1 enhanced serine sensitivity protein SseB C-terminal domain-containing protein [Edwardsiella anguillarum]WHQ20669.1 enhanced serine sensitivity protein SseB C-terminal domain-containing protein [Edwardsiella angui